MAGYSAALLLKKLDKNGLIWFLYIKKASKNYRSSFPESEGRSLELNIGLVDIKVCTTNEDWSRFKFVYRVEAR